MGVFTVKGKFEKPVASYVCHSEFETINSLIQSCGNRPKAVLESKRRIKNCSYDVELNRSVFASKLNFKIIHLHKEKQQNETEGKEK